MMSVGPVVTHLENFIAAIFYVYRLTFPQRASFKDRNPRSPSLSVPLLLA